MAISGQKFAISGKKIAIVLFHLFYRGRHRFLFTSGLWALLGRTEQAQVILR